MDTPQSTKIDYTNRGPEGQAAILSLTTFASLFVAARVYSCWMILRRRLYLEESIIVAAILIKWVSVALMLVAIGWGVGRHINTLSEKEATEVKFWYLLGNVPLLLALALPKFSVVNLLCRLFSPPRSHKILLWTATIICFMNLTAIALMFIFGCSPMAASWDDRIQVKKCYNETMSLGSSYYAAAFSAALDICFAVYPATRFSQLSCGFKKKLTLSVMMGSGIIAGAAGTYKGYILHLRLDDDYTWAILPLVIWTGCEADLIVIAACVPTLHPLYERVYERARVLFYGCGSSQTLDPVQPRAARDVKFHTRPRKGFWSAKLDSILSNTPSGTSSRSTTPVIPMSQSGVVPARMFEGAVMVTRPPEVMGRRHLDADVFKLPSPLERSSYFPSHNQ